MENKNTMSNEEVESEEVLKDMVQSLNELPTDVLKQLLENLNNIDEFNEEN